MNNDITLDDIQRDLYSKYIFAVYINIEEKINEIIEEGFDINYQFEDDNNTHLLNAVLDKSEDIIKHLLSLGSIKGINEALWHSITFSSYEIISLLVEKGADINYIHPLSKIHIFDSVISRNDTNILKLFLKYDTVKQYINENITNILNEVISRRNLDNIKCILDVCNDKGDVFPMIEKIYKGEIKVSNDSKHDLTAIIDLLAKYGYEIPSNYEKDEGEYVINFTI